MPIEYISTDQTMTYNITAGDDIVLLPGVLMTTTASNPAFFAQSGNGSDLSFTIHGTIYGDPAIELYDNDTISNVNDLQIINTATGFIHGWGSAMVIQAGENNDIVNYGHISADRIALQLIGGEARVENHGTISGGGETFAAAVRWGSINAGTNIREFVNTGIVSAGPTAATNATYATVSENFGAEFHFNNSGSIFGSLGTAVYSSAAEIYFDNSGLIEGNVVLGGGTTTMVEVFNSGIINGEADLSDAADYYFGSGNGVVTGRLDLNGGDDEAIMGDAGSFVDGGDGNDTIRGGTGSDEIEGGNDDDDIRGRAGADYLDGGEGNDVVRAGRGDDILLGGAGNDFMRGGAGDDLINGGFGQDIMFGNGGSDTFVFNTAAESTNAGAAWDRIMDFTQGQDQIDLTAFNARFIGTAGYAANGNIAEVRIFEDPNGDTRVFVDVNADGTSDMRFYLIDVLNVTADDFIL